MRGSPAPLWRVFPWDPAAAEGDPFSAAFVPGGQGYGRFDLPGDPRGVLYLAETPEHAVAEKIQDLRNQELEDGDLFEGGHRYARVQVMVSEEVWGGIVDLCDPVTLAERGIRPDEIAARDRRTTQRIARTLREAGATGLRWWSVFFGEWHNVVLFRDTLRQSIVYHEPRHLQADDPPMEDAAAALGILVVR